MFGFGNKETSNPREVEANKFEIQSKLNASNEELNSNPSYTKRALESKRASLVEISEAL